MAKTVYEGKEFNSKAELIRSLYDSGKLKNDNLSKKQIAKELKITVQTVHATLTKVLEESSNKIQSVSKRGKISDVIIIRSDENFLDKGKRIKICCAPNKWGLPITYPPTYVIDDNYKGDEFIQPENNTNLTNELISF